MATKIDRSSSFFGNRYRFDMKVCSPTKGWAQLDCAQDASYYGTWGNPFVRQIINYAEGDVTTTSADTDAEFVQEVRKWAEWVNEAGYGPARVDAGPRGSLFAAKWIDIGLGDLLFRETVDA